MDAATAGIVTNAVVLAAGVAIGVGAGYLLFPAIREAKVLREELDRARKDHDEYRNSVDAHFRKTADLVGQMTRSYAAVYDHLAVGARTFCDDAAAGSKVGFGPLPGTLASPDIEAAAEAAGEASAAPAVEATDAADTTPAPSEVPVSETTTGAVATASAEGEQAAAADEKEQATEAVGKKGDQPA